MGRLHELFDHQGQSPWLDNLRRDWVHGGELAAWVDRGVRGVTSNPSIFAKAMTDSTDYDADLRSLVAGGADVASAYWSLVVDDIRGAAGVLEPLYHESGGVDGFVSVEVSPELAHDTAATVEAGLDLHRRIGAPNLYIKVPATVAGVAAIRQLVAAGVQVNVTLIFSISRYRAVMEAYLAGLEDRLAAAAEGAESPLAGASGVASFFISRVDTAVDAALDAAGRSDLQGQAAVAQAKAAYDAFSEVFRGPRWERLAAAGALVQRPLWASTSTKNAAYPDTLYIDALIGPNTVNTIPDATIEAFVDHGTVARTIDADVAAAHALLTEIAAVGIDLEAVAEQLEVEGVASFADAFTTVLDTLATRVAELDATPSS